MPHCVCVCVCVCVCERERETERERQTDRQTERETQRERQKSEAEREKDTALCEIKAYSMGMTPFIYHLCYSSDVNLLSNKISRPIFNT